jgi:hypothetical protein
MVKPNRKSTVLSMSILSDIRTLGEDPFGKLVKYGHALMVDTSFIPSFFEIKELAGA